ncbi:hypothetical protein [Celeribacter litoreus]|uniref:hypothetical protein n=1 Tax=Celeribacter litoreus TaxID=2876714 RepID=UPI001CCA49AD|nr:hypothetical protein [Celeribacter litoreus]MCA0041869.1 hypothetical protein [Celeribacter litoreus]
MTRKRFVISAPRSGLNWVRFCTEYFYGQRTAGKTSLISESEDVGEAFIRSHDPLSWTRKRKEGQWQAIDPKEAEGGRVALVLRDPLETFVRMSKKRLHRFGCYAGNIRFYSLAAASEKNVFYYDELVSSPDVMMRLFTLLDMEPVEGKESPTLESLRAQWDEAGAKSRAMYDTKQAVGGGSKTKDAPFDFKFHQRSLTDAQVMKVWRYLKRTLSPEEFALLAHFDPPTDIPKSTLWQRLTDWI